MHFARADCLARFSFVRSIRIRPQRLDGNRGRRRGWNDLLGRVYVSPFDYGCHGGHAERGPWHAVVVVDADRHSAGAGRIVGTHRKEPLS